MLLSKDDQTLKEESLFFNLIPFKEEKKEAKIQNGIDWNYLDN